MPAPSSTLYITAPLALTDAKLLSSNVPETDYSAWNSGTTYAIGDRVILTSTHKVYESVIASNLNKQPNLNPTAWTEVGPTNRWKAWDASRTTATAQATSITYSVKWDQAISTMAVLDLVNCGSVNLTLVDPTNGTVYDKTVATTPVQPMSDWYSWFFDPRVSPELVVFSDVPAYPQATHTITITGGSSLAVGAIVAGVTRSFGEGIKAGLSLGITDYSRVETNDYGDTVLTRRGYAARASLNLLVAAEQVDQVLTFLAQNRATPLFFEVGRGRYTSTQILGFYKEYETTFDYSTHNELTIDIQGLK